MPTGPAEALAAAVLTVEVASSPAPRQVRRCVVTLPAGATVADALRASGWHAPDALPPVVAIRGQRVQPEELVGDGDRIDVCRPLKVDPKEARRLRYRAQGERGRGRPARRKAATG